MANVITAKIDVTLIDKRRLFEGRKKNKANKTPQYLDIVLIPTKQSNFGDWRDEQTHMVCQAVTKEERDAGTRGEILGNACEKVGDRDRRPPPRTTPAPQSPASEPPESDDVPF